MMLARRALCCAAVLAALPPIACGDSDQPVTWSASLAASEADVRAGTVVPVQLEAKAARGWYFYSIGQREGGPIPARIWLPDSASFALAGPVRGSEPSRAFDSVFGMEVEKHAGRSTFAVPVLIGEATAAGAHEVRVSARYQACNDRICHSPRTVTMSVPVEVSAP